MANLRDTGLPTNLRALESTRDILKNQIDDMEQKVTRINDLKLDLEAVENAIFALQGRVNFPAEEPMELTTAGNTWTTEKP